MNISWETCPKDEHLHPRPKSHLYRTDTNRYLESVLEANPKAQHDRLTDSVLNVFELPNA